MYIITENVESGEVDVFSANEEQVKLFENEPERFPNDITGWVIETAGDLEHHLAPKAVLRVYNALAEKPLVKFPNKTVGAARTMPLIERLAGDFEDLPLHKLVDPTPKTTTVAKGDGRKVRLDRGVHEIQPQEAARECRAGTKQQALIAALWKGSTMAELLEVTSEKNGGKAWKEGTIKSAFYHDVSTIKGYGVSTDTSSGDPDTYVYHLVLPEGITEPLPPKASPSSN